MTYELSYRVDLGSAQSPFRVVAQPVGREVGWINRFLDQCCVRGLAWHTLRGVSLRSFAVKPIKPARVVNRNSG
jgi:hypothetical protein